jgi:hypothetical protein
MPSLPNQTEQYWNSRDTITRHTRGTFPHARCSILRGSYPSPGSVIDRVDKEGNDWYRDRFSDLYLSDFIWAQAMVTARKQGERRERQPGRDRALEALIDRGISDRDAPEMRNQTEETAMRHASAMSQRLLTRLEYLEGKVNQLVEHRCMASN